MRDDQENVVHWIHALKKSSVSRLMAASASGLVKRLLVKAVIKQSATVAEHFGLDDEYLRDSSGCSFQIEISTCNVHNMYLP